MTEGEGKGSGEEKGEWNLQLERESWSARIVVSKASAVNKMCSELQVYKFKLMKLGNRP